MSNRSASRSISRRAPALAAVAALVGACSSPSTASSLHSVAPVLPIYDASLLVAADEDGRVAVLYGEELVAELRSRMSGEGLAVHGTIDVALRDGVVVLTGEVDDLAARDRAEDVVAAVRGVRAVVNQIDVTRADRGDDEVALDVKSAIAARPGLESFDFDVDVDRGVVTLGGVTSSLIERRAALVAARTVRGVVDVVDETNLVPQAQRTDEDIAEDIRDAFELDVRLAGRDLRVAVEDGVARLSGKVPTVETRRRAALWAGVAGVRGVDLTDVVVDPSQSLAEVSRRPGPDEARLADAVLTSLRYEPAIAPAAVMVSVDDGVARLRGAVTTAWARRAAEEAARNVRGLREVDNRLEVVPEAERVARSSTQKRAEAAIERLDPRGDPEVEVAGQTASLTGTVASRYEHEQLVRAIESIHGITEVTDDLEIVSPVDMQAAPAPGPEGEELENAIEYELLASSYVDMLDLAVLVRDGHVTLVGTVEEPAAVLAARRAARSAGAEEVALYVAVEPRARQ